MNNQRFGAADFGESQHQQGQGHVFGKFSMPPDDPVQPFVAAADKIRDDVSKGKTDNVEAHCAVMDEAATNLLMACGFQDLTGQRIGKVVNALIHLEGQIDDLFETLGISQGTGEGGLHAFAPDDKRPDTNLLHGPLDEGEGMSQAEIDALFD